jgi:flagellar basal body-associated protein FliL
MNAFKKFLGIFWLILAPLVIFALVNGAITNIDPSGKKDINNPIIWIIIITIFTPIAIGLMIFGWYAFRGEYDKLPQNSKELKENPPY